MSMSKRTLRSSSAQRLKKPKLELLSAASVASPSPTKKKSEATDTEFITPTVSSIFMLLSEQSIDLDVSRSYWLFKSEPTPRFHNGINISFSFTDLKNSPNSRASWDGVRNFEARNAMRDMKLGDLGFFYHSNCKVPGIVGIVKIVKEAYADFHAWDPTNAYYDAKSDKDNPKWFMVDVEYVCELPRLVTLEEIKQDVKLSNSPLQKLRLVKRGRLSVSKVEKLEWDHILKMAETATEDSTDA
ncbi:PUA-like domain-containing protein [Lipomyces japonicus]|uniref:PUA-like domain-containing protein n=1 Tax=Lipomyces japonicus TaxID=56871 RepID=UPI0034CD424C